MAPGGMLELPALRRGGLDDLSLWFYGDDDDDDSVSAVNQFREPKQPPHLC